ncbi:MAG: riboflavin synthase [Bdellovibrionales bacterium]|nr:riboflavin synthase [Bdellovibrionales bacterium]
MFSGIIEARSPLLSFKRSRDNSSIEILVERPSLFDDLKVGDSISINGTCLTIEEFSSSSMSFTLGLETLKVTNWEAIVNKFEADQECWLNLERSLRFGDRIHGHLVSGHVDSLGEVIESQQVGENKVLRVSYVPELSPYIWKKGSITLQGVSLTVNEVDEAVLSVGLIPETLRQTNLEFVKTGEKLNIEADYLAKMFLKSYESQRQAIVSKRVPNA